MNLLCDVGVDCQIVERLRLDGHDVLYVAELTRGIGDDEVLRTANDQAALVVTEDKDFGELVFRQHLAHQGVVLVRLMGLSSGLKARLVAATIRKHETEMAQRFTVISPGSVRIRQAI